MSHVSPAQPLPTPDTAPGLQHAIAAAEMIQKRTTLSPRVGLILGTGLGGLADRISDATVVPYSDIPHFPQPTVPGHAGRLVVGRFGGMEVAALQGRFHLYEGYTPAQVVLPTRVLAQLGIETLMITNAAGGLAPEQMAGDLMLIADHIGLVTLAGLNPLIGQNDERLGPRFPAMSGAYDAALRQSAKDVAATRDIRLLEGIYAMVSGPTFETTAELRFLRAIGADAVGMSTVPEVIAARHMGKRVLAISCITNVALPAESVLAPEASHAEVVAVAEEAGERLASLIEGILELL